MERVESADNVFRKWIDKDAEIHLIIKNDKYSQEIIFPKEVFENSKTFTIKIYKN